MDAAEAIPTHSNRSNIGIILSAFFCVYLSLFAWRIYPHLRGMVFAQDWMVFQTAAITALTGHYSLLADSFSFTQALTSHFEDSLHYPINIHPWVYPPPFLLIITPLGFLNDQASYMAFMFVGAGSLWLALHKWPAARSDRIILMASALLCPATMIALVAGQNAFLTTALLVAGFSLLERRPWLAGVLLGLLVFKPQVAVLVPVALLSARQWRAISAAFVSATVLCAASFLVFGKGVWVDWALLMSGASGEFERWEQAGRDNGMSVYACVHLLFASREVAKLVQGFTILLSASLTAYVCTTQPRWNLRVAAVLVAVELSAPHFAGYDMLIGSVGATIVWLHGCKYDFVHGELTLCLLCWVCPLLLAPAILSAAAFTPLLFLALLCCLASRSWRPTDAAYVRACRR